MNDTSFKSGLVWTPHYWKFWTYKAVILEQYADKLRMKTTGGVIFDVALSEIHAEFTRWGRMLLTIKGQTYSLVGNLENATFTKDQKAELQNHDNNAYQAGGITSAGVGAASTAASLGNAVGQAAGTAVAVAGAVGTSVSQYEAQGRIEVWHKILEQKRVTMKYTPANGMTYFLIFLAVAFVVGLFIAIKFFK